MKKLTQADVAEHLDLDQSAVSRLLQKLGLSLQTSALDDIRKKYIAHLREMAAGHVSPDGDSLVAERVMTERVDRELKMLTLLEKRGQLVNVAQLEQELSQMVTAFRVDLLARDDQLKTTLDTLYGIDLDLTILNDHTRATLQQLARYDPVGEGADQAPDADTATAGADQH
ncbi:MarR family transcriptional regulator [Methylobacillus flagellatus]|uniref:hypothetical protein n=1 Tax=Methylobacillus flagellatus TaxID=405 RepID=UPI002853935C|nr:hypothetical protein [Methylobacillus flagellatus]MDR5170718.1 MarR family transcriptional regulator [Methylobacillus flagellatus]